MGAAPDRRPLPSPAMAPPLYSVGHSNHTADHLLDLLARHGVEVVADLRSSPRSAFAPQFDRPALERALGERGIGSVWLGASLGGRPDDAGLYDADGHVRYDLVARSAAFRAGLGRLLDGASRFTVAMLCAEEDPTACHRRLLVTRVLESEGTATVAHLRGDGRVQTEADLPAPPVDHVQAGLFGDDLASWRSPHPTRRPGRPRPD